MAEEPLTVTDITGQAQLAGSINEVNVAMALQAENLPFLYQVPVRGGRTRRGGLVLDFLVFNPFEIAVPVHGEYWHTGQYGEDEVLETEVLRSIYNTVIPLWGNETQTFEAARNAVRQKIR